ncbi:hypothetical protein PoB_006974500 [Plakobranchus ocellatus]|uniref:CCHC-type domain-containing protein n=1 Tax=Plakobranchus ocellatus TaxID=259542 RepID=A0AAV4DGG9_9GAST|nr:hypothetical protein PoB_006974500 [Plakobranchus ocellatus]
MNRYGKDLQLFLKERKPTNTNDLVELAEKYKEAHRTVAAFSKTPSLATTGRPSSQNTMPEKTNIHPQRPTINVRCHKYLKPGHLEKNYLAKPQAAVVLSGVQCHYCHKHGHMKMNCPEKKKSDGNQHRNIVATIITEPSGRGSRRRTQPWP